MEGYKTGEDLENLKDLKEADLRAMGISKRGMYRIDVGTRNDTRLLRSQMHPFTLVARRICARKFTVTHTPDHLAAEKSVSSLAAALSRPLITECPPLLKLPQAMLLLEFKPFH